MNQWTKPDNGMQRTCIEQISHPSSLLSALIPKKPTLFHERHESDMFPLPI
jgi:hypothetical protein